MPNVRRKVRKVARKPRRRTNPYATTGRPRRTANAGAKGGFSAMRKMVPFSFCYDQSSGAPWRFIADNAGTLANPSYLQVGTPVVVNATASTPVYDVPFAMSFALNDLLGYTDFANIADKYRINKVMVRFAFNRQQAASMDASSIPIPMIEYIQDHDDNLPDTLAKFRERMGTKLAVPRGNGIIQVAIKPSILIDTNTSSAVVKYGQYLDTEKPAVQHFGLKGVFRNLSDLGVSGTSIINFVRIDVAMSLTVKNLQ